MLTDQLVETFDRHGMAEQIALIQHPAVLGESIVLIAWTRRLRLEEFEPAGAFVDTYRGHGPENPVR